MRQYPITIALALALAISAYGLAHASGQGLPSGLNVMTEPPDGIIDYEEEPPETDTFEKAGFKFFRWQTWSSERDNVLRNIVEPNYRERTGKELPKNPTFDFVLQNITGGKYNDVVVWSNLPGDCDPNGCKLQVFHMDDEGKWKVVAEFQAITVLHRYAAGSEKPIPELVAPGNDTTPTTLFRWDGRKFVEM